MFTHYAEGPRFCRGMNAPSATGCHISILRLFEPKVGFGAADSCRRGSTAICITTGAKAPGKTTRTKPKASFGVLLIVTVPLGFASGISLCALHKG
jgi:hypothetical protein